MTPPTHAPVPRPVLGAVTVARLRAVGTIAGQRPVTARLPACFGPPGRLPSARSGPDHDAACGEVLLRLPDGVLAEVKDRRGQYRARAAGGNAVVQMLERSDAAARNDGHGDGGVHLLQEFDVVAGFRTV